MFWNGSDAANRGGLHLVPLKLTPDEKKALGDSYAKLTSGESAAKGRNKATWVESPVEPAAAEPEEESSAPAVAVKKEPRQSEAGRARRVEKILWKQFRSCEMNPWDYDAPTTNSGAGQAPGATRSGTEIQPRFLAQWPLPAPSRWAQLVHKAQTEAELEVLRRCVNRGQPFGPESSAERQTSRPHRRRHIHECSVVRVQRQQHHPRLQRHGRPHRPFTPSPPAGEGRGEGAAASNAELNASGTVSRLLADNLGTIREVAPTAGSV